MRWKSALRLGLFGLVAAHPVTEVDAADKYDGWSFYMTEELYRICKSDLATDAASCAGYVCGVIDAWSAEYILTGKKLYKICLPTTPGSLTCAQIAGAVSKYLDDHPAARQGTAGGSVSYALQQTFPCKD